MDLWDAKHEDLKEPTKSGAFVERPRVVPMRFESSVAPKYRGRRFVLLEEKPRRRGLAPWELASTDWKLLIAAGALVAAHFLNVLDLMGAALGLFR